MKLWQKMLILTIVIAVPAFMAGPNAPLGAFWGMDPHAPQPTGAQLPLFMILGVLDALMFGLGISFLFFGSSLVRAVGGASAGLTRAAHLSLCWLFIQWWPHSNMHIVAGDDLGRILLIDYIFHVTIMAGSLILLGFFLAVVRERRAEARTAVA